MAKDPLQVTLENVRLSYPQLFKAKAFGEDQEGEPKFSASFLIDPTTKLGKKNIARMEDAIEEAKERKWPVKMPKLGAEKICLRDGDTKDDDGYEGMMFVTSSKTKRPTVMDRDKSPLVADDGRPYAGCFVDAIIKVWPQDNKWGKRVNASLELVRFRADGDAFGAAPVDPDDLPDLDDEDDDAPRRKKRPADDDDDEAPRKKRRPADDEDEPPRKKRRPADDDDEDEPPRKERRPAHDDDENEPPRKKRRPADDDEEDEPPRKKRRPADDDDEDEPPRRKKRRPADDDDEFA
jgi:hypothetical protein